MQKILLSFNILFFCSSGNDVNHVVMTIPDLPSDYCTSLMGDFADVHGRFMQCAGESARPLSPCLKCYSLADDLEFRYRLLKTSRDESNKTCWDEIYSKDIIDVISHLHHMYDRIMERTQCKKCLDSSFQLKDEVRGHWELFKKTVHCFTVDIANEQRTKNASASVCEHCQHFYKDLCKNNRLITNNGIGEANWNTCMDIIDQINTTHRLWDEVFGCYAQQRDVNRTHSQLLFTIVFASMLSVCLVFYSCVWLFPPKQEILQEKSNQNIGRKERSDSNEDNWAGASGDASSDSVRRRR